MNLTVFSRRLKRLTKKRKRPSTADVIWHYINWIEQPGPNAAVVKIFRFFILFLTLSMSMSCSGWVRSIGVIFGFLGGRLWGRGRLLAPPTASAESQRYTHINITTASMQRHSPAIVSLTNNSCFCFIGFLSTLLCFSLQLFSFCFTQLATHIPRRYG